MNPPSQPSVPAADLAHILSHTEGLWEALRGQSLLLTGGTGFFGRWLLESFAEANRRLGLGAQAVVLARHPEVFQAQAPGLAADSAIRFVRGNVRKLKLAEVKRQLGPAAPAGFSFVLHAASETSLAANRDNPLGALETSFEGTRRALDFAVATGAKGFLLLSSGAVYGEQPAALSHIPETYSGAPDVSLPLSAYGEGKRLAELECALYRRTTGLACKVARCFAFVGPYLALNAHYAIGNFLQDSLAERAIAIKGDGTPVRSYLYSADLAIWLWTILLHPGTGQIYNVGSDVPCSIRETAECVSHHSRPNKPVTVAQLPDPRRSVPRYVPDTTRARQELGLEVWTSLDSAVQKTLAFYQQQPKTR